MGSRLATGPTWSGPRSDDGGTTNSQKNRCCLMLFEDTWKIMETHFGCFQILLEGSTGSPNPWWKIPRERLFDHLSPVCSPHKLAEFKRSSTRVLGRWVGVRLLLIGGLFRRDSSKRLGHVGTIQALLPRHFFLDDRRRSRRLLTISGDVETFKRRRAAELKHGRICMLACVGGLEIRLGTGPGWTWLD